VETTNTGPAVRVFELLGNPHQTQLSASHNPRPISNSSRFGGDELLSAPLWAVSWLFNRNVGDVSCPHELRRPVFTASTLFLTKLRKVLGTPIIVTQSARCVASAINSIPQLSPDRNGLNTDRAERLIPLQSGYGRS
jgi:hypothetical protein